ncbi:hypothetical protein ACFZAV_42680 [Streptomyces sp. NPDC008343]|uniref:hypothetical protein n=1 Tax=Streptomyces sp. NPDC008343 TaxID=3364828 RepID=UPI0036E68B4D
MIASAAHTVTEAELARIDAENDRHREIFNSLWAGGFSPDSIRHAMRANAGVACPDHCVVCIHTRIHAGCTGCPDC